MPYDKRPFGRFDFSPKALSQMFAMGFMLDLLINRGMIKTFQRRMRMKKTERFIEISNLFK